MISTQLSNQLRAGPSASRSVKQSPTSRKVVCLANNTEKSVNHMIRDGAMSFAACALLFVAQPVHAGTNQRLPPLDPDPNRCERAFVGNTIGQANAVSDKILDLRMCDLTGKNLSGKTLSGALLVDANLSGANLQEAVMSKAYAVNVNLSSADLTNAVIDRVVLDKANLTKAKFVNTVITGTTFDGADLTDAIFEDALIGNEDAKRLCLNPTLKGESRLQVGCRS